MKKKIGLIAFIMICTIGITAGIASFTFGKNDVQVSAGDNSLAGIYDSFKSQIQHIIDNSNLNETGDNAYSTDITHYHILQIVDSETVVDSESKKLSKYISDYINNEEDEQSLQSGNFRTDVIGKEMKNKHIDIDTCVASSSSIDNKIKNADLIYIACNSLYTANGNDLSTEAYELLRKYALTDFKPVIIDSDVVGITNKDIEADTNNPTLLYEYLKRLKGYQGTTSDTGVASVKDTSLSWADYLDETKDGTTYVSFDNSARATWSTFDYEAGFKHKVLEIVPNDASKSANTSFHKCIEDDTFLQNAFFKTDGMTTADNIEYKIMTAEEFNQLVASSSSAKDTLNDYNFVYISHESNDKIYYNKSDTEKYDFSEDAITALKAFVGKTSVQIDPKAKEKDYVNRLMIDGNFFNVYIYASSESSNGKVDTSTNIYKLATEIIDKDTGKEKANNVLTTSSGFFGVFKKGTDEKKKEAAQSITDLINKSTYRKISPRKEGANFKVLEIEPYYNVEKTEWYTKNKTELTNTLYSDKVQEEYQAENSPYYYANLTKARVAAATGLNVDQISVTFMSANGLSSTSPTLVEDYDLIYIGNQHDNIKDTNNWFAKKVLNSTDGTFHMISMNPTNLKEFYFNKNGDNNYITQGKMDNSFLYPGYTHTGEYIHCDEQDDASDIFDPIVDHKYKECISRLNGNDITYKVYQQLFKYVKSGMPLICAEEVLNSDYLIGGASENAEMVKDTKNPRLVLKADRGEDTISFEPKSGSKTSVTYNSTKFSDKTMTARRESKIDPESYMYQLMYEIAEDKDSGIYHAANVFAGFNSSDTVTASNRYRAGVTSDSEETAPDDINTADYAETKKLVDSLEIDSNITIFNNSVKKNALGSFNFSKSGAGVQLKHFLNSYATTRPIINLIKAPVDYDSHTDMDKKKRVVNSKKPVFSFSINGEAGKTYTVRLYYDFDGDGKYSDDATEGRLEGTSYDNEIVAQTTYTVGTSDVVTFDTTQITESYANATSYVKPAFEIDEDFVGVMPYKLVVIDGDKQTSITGTPKYYSKEDNKQTLRLLNIVPGNEQGHLDTDASGNCPVTTLCANENTKRQADCQNDDGKKKSCYGYQDHNKHTFGIVDANDSNVNLAASLEDEYDVQLTILTFGQIGEIANYYLADYCKHFEDYSERDELTSEEKTAFKNKFMDVYYSNGSLSNEWKKIVDIKNTTYYDFNSKFGICDKILCSWLSNGDEENKVTIGTKDYEGKTQTFNMGGYDMIVMGFSRMNGGSNYPHSDITNIGCQFIRAYVENNDPILLGCDTTSWRGFDTANDLFWSRNINKYLRGCFGMDRFKFTKDGEASKEGSQPAAFYQYANNGQAFNSQNARAFLYTPYNSSEYQDKEGQTLPGEFFTMNSYDGTYESPEETKYISGGGATDAVYYAHSQQGDLGVPFKNLTAKNKRLEIYTSEKVVQNNQGLITQYPFTLGNQARISATPAQYMALDTEDKYMSVWYTLAGDDNSDDSSFYAADPYNGRSYYYIYTYKNVTYTGAGYNAIAETMDNNEERELLINSVISNVKLHRGGPKVSFSKYSQTDINDDSKFTPENGTNSAILECTAQSKEKCNFDFKVSTASNRTLESVILFIDTNEDGKYNVGDGDILVKDYGKDVPNNKPVSVKGSELPNEVSNYMQGGSFYLTVYAKDSADKTGNNKILIKTKSKLFNLN